MTTTYSIWRDGKYVNTRKLTEKEAEQLRKEGYKLYNGDTRDWN